MSINDLLLALAAAGNDAERRKVLATAPASVRDELAGQLAYREMLATPTDTLLSKLDAAADDTERAALLKAATPKERKALADDLWWKTARTEDCAQRYLDMIVTERMQA